MQLLKTLIFLLLLIGCDNIHEPMTQSDALPLQWFPEGVKTFNEQKHCGIEHKCWYQPWRCDVDLIDQFYDGSIRDYVLRALDSQDELIFEKDYEVINFNFLGPMSDWTVIAGPDANWSAVGSDHPLVTFPAFSAQSDRLKSDVALVTGKTYRIMYSFTGTTAATVAHFVFRDSLGADITPTPVDIAVPVGTTSGYIDITLDDPCIDITLAITCVLGLTPTLTVNYIQLYDSEKVNTNIVYVLAFNPDFEGICGQLVKFELWDITDVDPVRISRTDLMFFRDSDCISAWQYKGSINYAGLTYILPDDDADPLFNLCVEGVFVHERDITEEVVVELTEQTIGTATSIKKQKLLTVQDAPDFFHRKIQLMLAHGFIGSVTDDVYNRTWLKEEKYEKEIRDRRYILKEGNVQLTDINYLKRGAI